MNRSFILTIALLFFFINVFAQQSVLKSPDGNLELRFNATNKLSTPLQYSLYKNAKGILQNASVKLVMDDKQLRLEKDNKKSIRSSWKPVWGERDIIPDNYNEYQLQYSGVDENDFGLTITLRLYNEGFAYQYAIKSNNEIVLKDEASSFGIDTGATAWASTTAQGNITAKKINTIKDVVERPLTIKLKDSFYIAIGEAGLVNFSRMKFAFVNNELITKLDGVTKNEKELVSPWRFVIVGKTPGQLLERNYLVQNLNAPCAIKDTRWIKPGKVLREITLTTKGAYNTIDFAAKHNIAYILFDAGWYGREDHDTSNALRVSLDPLRSKGVLGMKEVIHYGNSKNVGVILYVNRRALERQLDSLLPVYQQWGVKGLKFGFVQVGSQYWTNWLHESIRKCAKYKMLVDVHDEYRPTGYSRTYPNLLTQEGIRGDEESPFTEHSITTIFTRMLAGAGDNTICYFTNRVDKMGSHTAQMAKALCIYSPLEFLYWYDHPKSDTLPFKEGEIQETAELDWFDKLPLTWDETKVLESDMEKYVTIARRSGKNWYVASLNGTTERSVTINFSFLTPGKKYEAIIYTHDLSIATVTHVKKEKKFITSKDEITINLHSRDGFAIQLLSK